MQFIIDRSTLNEQHNENNDMTYKTGFLVYFSILYCPDILAIRLHSTYLLLYYVVQTIPIKVQLTISIESVLKKTRPNKFGP